MKRISEEPPFFKDALNWFDFLAIMPFYIEQVAVIFAVDFSTNDEYGPMLKLIRLFRICRIFKVVRHFEATRILYETFRTSMKPLIVPVLFLVIFVLLFGAIIYFIEPCYDLETCEFSDILNTAYFVCITMTSVGYGDQIPQTQLAAAVAGFAMLFGALFMAMPIAIIGNNFERAWDKMAPDLLLEDNDEEEANEVALKSMLPVDPDTFRESAWKFRRERASTLYFSLTRRLSKLHAMCTRAADQMVRAETAPATGDGTGDGGGDQARHTEVTPGRHKFAVHQVLPVKILQMTFLD